MLRTTAPGNILATFHGRPISQWETHDGDNKPARTTPRVNSDSAKTEGSGTRKFNGVDLVVSTGHHRPCTGTRMRCWSRPVICESCELRLSRARLNAGRLKPL